jgi:hypothetical protein
MLFVDVTPISLTTGARNSQLVQTLITTASRFSTRCTASTMFHVYKRGDLAAMDSLLADDFIITVEDGGTFSKPGYIAHNGQLTESQAWGCIALG